jgi:hypothetical protein
VRPGGDAIRRRRESDVTLLPQPDSPTMASVSPRPTENDTPSTARTTPSRVKKCVFRLCTSSSGATDSALAITSAARAAGRVRRACRRPADSPPAR